MADKIENKIIEYLQSHNVVTIAISDGKEPSAHTVFYICHGLHIYFFTDPHSKKVHILRSNPRISATVDEDYPDWSSIKGLQIFGRAKIHEKVKSPKITELFEKKFADIKELGGIPDFSVFVEIIPEKINYLDYTEKFGKKDIYYSEDNVSIIEW